ncbi:MAG: cytochrome c maturation protein CcmE [Euryarchaeota archaeon]|nr:cytochrome c maturation protein CcmE [Euryarchaeota archaeon]
MVKMSKNLKIGIGILLIAVCIAIGYSTVFKFFNPYHFVSNLTANPDQYMNKQVQVIGVVVPGTIELASGTLKFDITDGNSRIKVAYGGSPVPIRESINVVVIGSLISPTQFQATKILTQCPSKYEQTLSAANKT